MKSLSLTQHYTKTYYHRGLIYGKTGNHQRAIDNYSKAIELDPNFAQAYYNRGVIFNALNQVEAALGDLQRYLDLSPDALDKGKATQIIQQIKEAMAG